MAKGKIDVEKWELEFDVDSMRALLSDPEREGKVRIPITVFTSTPRKVDSKKIATAVISMINKRRALEARFSADSGRQPKKESR